MRLRYLLGSLLLAVVALPAQATVIGTAVSGNGSSTQVGSTSSDGSINFYALLRGSGTYGVSGAGLTADTCKFPSTCTGGRLDIWLRFAPATLGANTLTLQFTDFDIFGVNDPAYFLESVAIYDGASNNIAFVDQVTDPEVVSASTNYNTQMLRLAVNVSNNPFYTRLSFMTRFLSNTPLGTYINTPEKLLATMTAVPPVAVPEPATFALLGLGLALIGFVGNRRRITS